MNSESSFSTPSLTIVSENSDEEYSSPNFWALPLLLLCVVVVFGNVLVILSVAREKVLQNMTNYFIVSLAVADLLVAGFVMPFSVYVLVNWGVWGLPKITCDFYIALDVVCSTSSIFNLVAISIDRYYAVTAPIKYSQHRDKHARAYVIILLCWLASITIGSPIMLGANQIPDSAYSRPISGKNESLVPDDRIDFVCAFYNPEFIIYSSLGSFYIPCIVMIFLYVRIFKALHDRALLSKNAKGRQIISSSNASGKPKEGNISTTVGASIDGRKSSSKLEPNKLLQCNAEADETKFHGDHSEEDSVEEDFPSSPIPTKPNMHHKACGTEGGKTLLKIKSTNGTSAQTKTSSNGVESRKQNPKKEKSSGFSFQSSMFSSYPKDTTKKKSSPSGETLELKSGSSETTTAKFKKVLTMNQIHRGSRKQRKRKKEKCYAKKERKATKTLAVVLACFLVCWIPFFTCNIVNAVCIKFEFDSGPGDTAFILTTWLGYINSCINPLIYTIFNPEFKKAFKRILGLGH